MVSVASRAHRILRGIPRYRHFGDQPDDCRRLAASTDEEIVGVYENPPNVEPPSIVITESGLSWRTSAGEQRAAFSRLRSVRGPDDKSAGDEITLTLHEGATQIIRVAGGDGKYKDVHSMVQFLARVSEKK